MTIRYPSVITLNVSGLNAPIKRHRLADWIIKQEPTVCWLPYRPTLGQRTHGLKLREWKTIFLPNGNNNNMGGWESTLISNNTDLKTKAIKKHTHNIMIKRSI